MEDRGDFPVVLARARAKGRGQVYDPKIHGPFERDGFASRIDAAHEQKLAALISEWSRRAWSNRYLRAS